MANLIENAKKEIDGLLARAYEKAAAAGELPAGAALTGTVEIPKDVQNGDYAANHAMVGAKAEFKPVTILAEGEDFFLVESAPFQNPDNTAETKRALRSGDEIIVRAEDLYDGKILRTG